MHVVAANKNAKRGYAVYPDSRPDLPVRDQY
jgi:hypothetical protein